MGIQNHKAIVATTWDKGLADNFDAWAIDHLGGDRVLRSEAFTNGYQTFLIVPDGSKIGWEESNQWNALRDDVVARLTRDQYEDNSSPWDWVEVGYGEYGQKVLRGNCTNCYSDTEYHGD